MYIKLLLLFFVSLLSVFADGQSITKQEALRSLPSFVNSFKKELPQESLGRTLYDIRYNKGVLSFYYSIDEANFSRLRNQMLSLGENNSLFNNTPGSYDSLFTKAFMGYDAYNEIQIGTKLPKYRNALLASEAKLKYTILNRSKTRVLLSYEVSPFELKAVNSLFLKSASKQFICGLFGKEYGFKLGLLSTRDQLPKKLSQDEIQTDVKINGRQIVYTVMTNKTIDVLLDGSIIRNALIKDIISKLISTGDFDSELMMLDALNYSFKNVYVRSDDMTKICEITINMKNIKDYISAQQSRP